MGAGEPVVPPGSPALCEVLFLWKGKINGGRVDPHLHRYHPRHHLASSWCLLQVRLQGGVLDLSSADPVWVSPRNYLCCLCHHQELISPPAASINSQGEDLRSTWERPHFWPMEEMCILKGADAVFILFFCSWCVFGLPRVN
ncbi:hypothetical protein RHMOL_Rhmol11G0166300 [Rhododendron molle]|uniref:Uncharacterized protein n=1 Tax=Rhododendron molle TaxID=49168 RepID=A0ACC0LTY1_RHOML|nr:hypothetical protein RHMOL_Rhmol11G0166300 [Rhododendron molle]